MTKSEAVVQDEVRLEAPNHMIELWRNNVVVLKGPNGRPVRCGLCNDSPALNEKFKSGDLIGITQHVVTMADVGKTLGIFTSFEIKPEGWVFTGRGREGPQDNWRELVNRLGGIAKFIADVKDL